MSIPDLDVINDKATLRSLFESHGGSWAEIERDVDTLLRFIGSRKRTNATKDVKGEIASILDSITVSDGGPFPRDAAAKIRDALSGASPWREIKESGIKALGKGTNQVAAKGLLGAMEKRGILVPPVGEMESFYSLASLRSMEWVKEVLDLDVQNDDNLSDARKFAKKILAQGK